MDKIYIYNSDLVPVSAICKYFGIDQKVFDVMTRKAQLAIIHQYYATINNR